MFINFWYPIATSEEVTNDKPRRVQVLGLKFVAFRDEGGEAHVLSDVCIHRGGALGKGWVRNNTVVCPYHGWRFAGNGRCTAIPTISKDDKPPARAKVDSYPVREKYGIVFAFLGDLPEEERPPLHEVEEYNQKGWRANKLVVFEVGAFYERSIENGLDPSHNEFVHPAQGSPVMNSDVLAKPLDVKNVPWGSQFLVKFYNPAVGTRKFETNEQMTHHVTAGSGHFGPNTMITWIKLSEDNIFHQYFFEAPIDESHTRIFFLSMRTFMLEPEMDERLTKISLVIAQEDIDILEDLTPVRTPELQTKEVLIAADKAVVRYREYLKDWENMGWRIDMTTLRATFNDVGYAVPSPDRRSSGNWVLDPIPTLPAVN